MNQSVVQRAKEICRELRKRSTPSERLFWHAVRNRKMLGKKFLRQYPVFFMYMNKKTFFIADFYCDENRLVVEIDGKSHDHQKEHDELRTYIINNLDIEVVRFRNEEIEKDIRGVLDRLGLVLNHGTHRTHPKSLS